jgi:hypothetical protein
MRFLAGDSYRILNRQDKEMFIFSAGQLRMRGKEDKMTPQAIDTE